MEPFKNGNIKSEFKRTGKRLREDSDHDGNENNTAAAKRPRKPKQTQNAYKIKPVVMDPALSHADVDIQIGMESARNYSVVLNSNSDDSEYKSSVNTSQDQNGSYNPAQPYNGGSCANQST